MRPTERSEAPAVPLIDLHSHLLPKMDDGSKSPEESLEMAHLSFRYGVRCMVLTPHFYAERDYPDSFLARRKRCFRLLQEVVDDRCPGFVLGAEVRYFDGVSRMEELDTLCIGDSGSLLLEMPFRKWTNQMINEVLDLAERPDVRVILAHIERYLPFMGKETLPLLVENGVRIQANASSFLRWMERRTLLKLLKQKQIHVIGTDCHNLTTRPPNLGEAVRALTKSFGPNSVNWLMRNAEKLIKNPDEG